MLAFITSLRHPRNSGDYGRVEQLLAESLRSVVRQEHAAFSVWVVGNQRPEQLPGGVNWVNVGFPPPSDLRGPITGRDAVLLDKGTKLAIGLAAARAAGPAHVMFFDADDLVSNRLATISATDPSTDGWRITEGWRWSSERHAIRRQPEFHRHCGTAFLVRPELYELPAELDPRSSQSDIRDALGDRLFRHFGSHLHLSDDLAAIGHPLTPLDHPAALYRVGTGENHSGVSLGGFGRPISRAVAQEFGISPTPPSMFVRSVLPSLRALERLRGVATIRRKPGADRK